MAENNRADSPPLDGPLCVHTKSRTANYLAYSYEEKLEE